jgi:hypothetical protein
MRDSAPSISVITAPGKPMHAVQLVKENPPKKQTKLLLGEWFHLLLLLL